MSGFDSQQKGPSAVADTKDLTVGRLPWDIRWPHLDRHTQQELQLEEYGRAIQIGGTVSATAASKKRGSCARTGDGPHGATAARQGTQNGPGAEISISAAQL